MIRIRYPDNAIVPPAVLQRPSIELTDDPHILTAESEKNDAETADRVNRFLRPIFAQRWKERAPLFQLISVETHAGCNHVCTFCPVARTVDPRPPGEMSNEMLSSIAAQLRALDYAGRVSLFGNNEPFLDDRLRQIVGLFRRVVPSADLRVLTNGTKIRRDLVRHLFAEGLSTLIINNYTNGNRLIRPVQTLIDSATEFADVDIRINMRYRDEILTTRAGTAPNKPIMDKSGYGFCALPFTDLHIAYTGEVNICCFDAYGVTVVGNVADELLTRIWYGDRLQTYRDKLLKSDRDGLVPCKECDFDGFRDPMAGSGGTLIRSDLHGDAQSGFPLD